MNLTKVLEMLYGKVKSGYLQATYIDGDRKCISRCFTPNQFSDMELFIREKGSLYNTYIEDRKSVV